MVNRAWRLRKRLQGDITDDVGGAILEACVKRMSLHGRIPTRGLIPTYNAAAPVAGPCDYAMILMQRLRVEGFIGSAYARRTPAAVTALAGRMRSSELDVRLDLAEGLGHALGPLARRYSGGSTGTSLLRVGPC